MDEVVVWGTGKHAIDFVTTNADINIIAFIDNNKGEEQISWNGIPVLFPSEAQELLNNRFIIVATSENVYWEIRRWLISIGRKEFDHFLYHSCYKKRIAMIYGNCHTQPVKEGLVANALFRKIYGFYPLRQIQEIKKNNDEGLESEVFQHCDLMIHQSVRKDNRYGENYSSEYVLRNIREECVVIAMPNLYGLPKCFFPHHEFVNGGSGKYIKGISYFPYRDLFIDEEFKQGKRITEIAKEIQFGKHLKEDEIKAGFESFINKVEKREMEWDIKVRDWLIDNYQNVQLFYDANHPTGAVVRVIVSEVLRILGIEEEYVIDYYPSEMDANEIPIYGEIAEGLGLKYSNNLMRIHSRKSMYDAPLTIYDYVEQYVLWNVCSG